MRITEEILRRIVNEEVEKSISRCHLREDSVPATQNPLLGGIFQYLAPGFFQNGQSTGGIGNMTIGNNPQGFTGNLDGVVQRNLGMRYRMGGNGSDGSIDCSAYTSLIYKNAFGKNLPRTAAQQYQACTPINPSQAQKGDLIFFKNTNSSRAPGTVTHVGVYMGNNQFTHASSSRGTVIDNLSSYWMDPTRFAGFGRPAQA